MPPKKVYGKRSNKVGRAFTEFLSPEHDEVQRRKESKINNTAHKHAGDGEPKGFEAIEKQLEELSLQAREVAPDSTHEEKSQDAKKARKALRTKDENTRTTKDIELVRLEDAIEKDVRKEHKKSHRREKSAVEAPIPDSTEKEIQKEHKKSHRREKPTVEAPIPDPTETEVQKERKKSHRREKTTVEAPQPEATEPRIRPATLPKPSQSRIKAKKRLDIPPQPPISAPVEPEHAPEPEIPNVYTTHVSPLLKLSTNPSIRPFASWSAELEPHFHVSKIAEASYGEVYRLSLKSHIQGLTRADESVLKIIAIKPPPDAPTEPIPITGRSKRGNTAAVAEEVLRKMEEERKEKEAWMSGVESILSEVQLLQHLTPIPGFTNFRDLVLLQGRPPPEFVQAWKAWNKGKKGDQRSVFPDPGKKGSYGEGQLWAVIEMQDAGTDLERLMEGGGCRSIWEVWDVFWGVVLGLGKGEEGVRFEHRDLHLGNICIRSRNPDIPLTHPPITLNSLHQKLGFTPLETTLIDYTLSRADMTDPYPESQPSSPSPHSSSSPSQTPTTLTKKESQPEVAFLDLDTDQALFSGNADVEYQYEIYRYMRSSVYHDSPLIPYEPPHNQDEVELQRNTVGKKDLWWDFHPRTNLLWLHFLLFKLSQVLEFPSSSTAEQILERINSSSSSSESTGDAGTGKEDSGVKSCGLDARKVHKMAMRLEKILRKVERALEPGELRGEEGLGSVRELVWWAVGEGWIGEGDVQGY